MYCHCQNKMPNWYMQHCDCCRESLAPKKTLVQNVVLKLGVSGLPLVHSFNWVIISLTHIWAKHTSNCKTATVQKWNVIHWRGKNNSIWHFCLHWFWWCFFLPKLDEGRKKGISFCRDKTKRVVYFLHFCPELCKKKPLDCLDCWPDSELENV